MRCADSVTIYAFADAGATRASYESLVLAAPGSSCSASQLVVMSGAEYDQIATNPFNLSLSDGALVSVAVIGVWATAWAFRVLIRMIREDDPVVSE
jgi:hypothetical protein